MRHVTCSTLILLVLSSIATAQTGNTTAPQASPTQQKSIASNLGVYVFPANNQTPEQQSSDEAACYGWAKNETGIDPSAPPPAASAQQQSSTPSTKGSGAKGAAGGAAGGAAMGAIAGDAGTGAAMGATAGAVRGRRQAKKAEKQAEAQQQQAQAHAQQQAGADRKAAFNRGFSACMQGKGYSVK